MSPKVYLQTLGCPKNQVDSEVMLGLLVRAGAQLVLDPAAADVCVVNTCGFIGPAKEESIGAILQLARHKEEDPGKRLVVAGCLAQRYAGQLRRALPEADAFVGLGEFDRLLGVIAGRHDSARSPARRGSRCRSDTLPPRLRTGPFFSAYLKVSEGCNHRCAFCAIPTIRGRHRSRPPESILAEAEQLAGEGVVELNLVAQDLTAYGRDLRRGLTRATLLRQLARVPGIRLIRLLYGHPASVDDSPFQVMAASGRICP